jgi:hypothetical protein
MEDRLHTKEVGAAGAGVTTPPTQARIAPETVVKRRSTDDTCIQESDKSDYYEYNEKAGEAGSVYSGPGGVEVTSSYSGNSRTRHVGTAAAKDVFDEKEKDADEGRKGRGDVESQISSVDPEDNSPIEEVRAIVPGKGSPLVFTAPLKLLQNMTTIVK